MGQWSTATWESSAQSGLPRRDRRSGTYLRYLPDPLVGLALRTSPELDRVLADAERVVARLDAGADTNDLAGLSRFLLRSEAIASSRIEGIAPSPRQVALAELPDQEKLTGLSDQARLVARNMTLVSEASTRLAAPDRITVDDIVRLHTALLHDEPRHHGLRTVQNWIGGSDHHPIDAAFVPPPAEDVPALLGDLVAYLGGASHAPIVQAALVHAQFETIHPFTDGNGRVGRALIHTALTRRGLTRAAILPVSLVLSTFRDDYVRGLTAFRHDAAPDSDQAHAAREAWLAEFARAVHLAATQAEQLRDDVADLRKDWHRRLDAHRATAGRHRTLRSDSATALILRGLPGTPVLTTATVQRLHGVTGVAAARALGELTAAGILDERPAGRGAKAYSAGEVLDLISSTERRLASTRFDTRISPPNRPVPAAPPRQDHP